MDLSLLVTIRHGRIYNKLDLRLEMSHYVSAIRKRIKLNQFQQEVSDSKNKFNFTFF